MKCVTKIFMVVYLISISLIALVIMVLTLLMKRWMKSSDCWFLSGFRYSHFVRGYSCRQFPALLKPLMLCVYTFGFGLVEGMASRFTITSSPFYTSGPGIAAASNVGSHAALSLLILILFMDFMRLLSY